VVCLLSDLIFKLIMIEERLIPINQVSYKIQLQDSLLYIQKQSFHKQYPGYKVETSLLPKIKPYSRALLYIALRKSPNHLFEKGKICDTPSIQKTTKKNEQNCIQKQDLRRPPLKSKKQFQSSSFTDRHTIPWTIRDLKISNCNTHILFV